VTQKGLEDQLLSRVIQQEQAPLEEQRLKLTEEVNISNIHTSGWLRSMTEMASSCGAAQDRC